MLTDSNGGCDHESFDAPGTDKERQRRAGRRSQETRATRDCPHPTTAEMHYTQEEIEFMAAMTAWTQRTGRKFPTLTETLRVAKNLGYERVRDID